MAVDGVLGFVAYGMYTHRVKHPRFMKYQVMIRLTRLPEDLLA